MAYGGFDPAGPPSPVLLHLGGGQLNKAHPISFCSQGRQRRAPPPGQRKAAEAG